MYYGKIWFNLKTEKLNCENNKPNLLKLGKVIKQDNRKVHNDDSDL